MKCPIRFGKLNKWHFCILATVGMKLFNALISGVSLSREKPNDKFYLFGYPPIFINHLFIQSSFSFFGIFLLGLILFIMKKIVRKQINEEEGLLEIKKEINDSEIASYKYVKKDNKYELFKESIFVIFIFAFAILSLSIYDSLGFNELKIWPLEYSIIFLFSKKYLNKVLYKHQKLALFLILIFCNIGFLIVSFIHDGNSGNSGNVYEKIIQKLSVVFIPIIMILYLISMTANSYGMVKIKYLIDIKFVDTYIILMILGMLGFLMSTILAIISTFIQCAGKVSIHIEDVCKINFNNKLYFDSFLDYFKSLNGSDHFLSEIIFALPVFLIINALISLFNVLIIKELDPFYLIPVRTIFYFIYRILDFRTISDSSKLFTPKFVLHEITNLFSVICSLIYLEIIILNFCNFEKDVKKCIEERERIDVELANEKEEEPSKIEIEINENYTVEI